MTIFSHEDPDQTYDIVIYGNVSETFISAIPSCELFPLIYVVGGIVSTNPYEERYRGEPLSPGIVLFDKFDYKARNYPARWVDKFYDFIKPLSGTSGYENPLISMRPPTIPPAPGVAHDIFDPSLSNAFGTENLDDLFDGWVPAYSRFVDPFFLANFQELYQVETGTLYRVPVSLIIPADCYRFTLTYYYRDDRKVSKSPYKKTVYQLTDLEFSVTPGQIIETGLINPLFCSVVITAESPGIETALINQLPIGLRYTAIDSFFQSLSERISQAFPRLNTIISSINYRLSYPTVPISVNGVSRTLQEITAFTYIQKPPSLDACALFRGRSGEFPPEPRLDNPEPIFYGQDGDTYTFYLNKHVPSDSGLSFQTVFFGATHADELRIGDDLGADTGRPVPTESLNGRNFGGLLFRLKSFNQLVHWFLQLESFSLAFETSNRRPLFRIAGAVDDFGEPIIFTIWPLQYLHIAHYLEFVSGHPAQYMHLYETIQAQQPPPGVTNGQGTINYDVYLNIGAETANFRRSGNVNDITLLATFTGAQESEFIFSTNNFPDPIDPLNPYAPYFFSRRYAFDWRGNLIAGEEDFFSPFTVDGELLWHYTEPDRRFTSLVESSEAAYVAHVNGLLGSNFWSNFPMTDSLRIKQIHRALSADTYSIDPADSNASRVATLGYLINRIAEVLGLLVNADGTPRSIRQQRRLDDGSEIPAGWLYGQFGQNSGGSVEGQTGGNPGELRNGIAYQSRCNKILPNEFRPEESRITGGDIILCESWPQYLDAVLDDLEKAIGWQELGAFVVPNADGSGKFSQFEGLAAVAAELAYMLSSLSGHTSQTLISSVTTQAVTFQVLQAFGVPLEPKNLDISIGEGQTALIHYPALALDAPRGLQQTLWILNNLALIVGSIVQPTENEVSP